MTGKLANFSKKLPINIFANFPYPQPPSVRSTLRGGALHELVLLAPGAQRRVVVGEDGERARDENAGAGDGDADLRG